MTTAQYIKKDNKGFTLIELLVVIAIIAILAVIGISVFSGAQGSARDGRRRSEINSMSKSIEASKDFEKGVYKYATADSTKDFPRGFPDDPSTPTVSYCINTSTSTTPPAALTTAWTTGGCPTTPTGWKTVSSSLSTTTTNNLGATTPDVKSWTLCAALERSTTPFCISSLTQ